MLGFCHQCYRTTEFDTEYFCCSLNWGNRNDHPWIEMGLPINELFGVVELGSKFHDCLDPSPISAVELHPFMAPSEHKRSKGPYMDIGSIHIHSYPFISIHIHSYMNFDVKKTANKLWWFHWNQIVHATKIPIFSFSINSTLFFDSAPIHSNSSQATQDVCRWDGWDGAAIDDFINMNNRDSSHESWEFAHHFIERYDEIW